MLQPAATLPRSVGSYGSSIVDLRAAIRAKDAENARLRLALAAAERETAEWRMKWQLAYGGDGCPMFDDIVDMVCAEFKVSKVEILGDQRSAALARHVGMYLCARKTKRSFPVIGRYFRRDHSTVLRNCRRLAAKLEKNAALAARVNRLSEQLDGVA